MVADAAVLAGRWQRLLASDRNPARCGGELLPGVALLPPEQATAAATAVHVAIGNAQSREQEASAWAAGMLATVIHPQASVSAHAQVASGCFIASQAVVAAGAQLGTAVIVNHGAVVDHDARVGDFSHIAPLAALGGGVHIGRRVLVGSGASILPGVRVGDDVLIGAGAVVLEHIREPGSYAGVPARRVA